MASYVFSLPEFGLSLSISLLKLSMEMLSLMSLMYESSSDALRKIKEKRKFKLQPVTLAENDCAGLF